jgi:iron-sulfur cluster repair protein YtfE (RIC family)
VDVHVLRLSTFACARAVGDSAPGVAIACVLAMDRSDTYLDARRREEATDDSFEDVRLRIVHEHTAIKAELGVLRDAAQRVMAHDERGPIALREALWEVYTRLVDHLAMEENNLLPLLEQIDSWGPHRAENMLEDHRQQRVVLDAIIDECECGTKDDLELADDALWLVASLEKDIAAENAALEALANPPVLDISAE